MTHKNRIYTFLAVLILTLAMLPGCHAVEADTQGPLNNLNNFTAYTMKGKEFTQADFADYDIVIICFWAPWSDSSIFELKNLVNLSDKLPDNISFISVCLDSELTASKARLKKLNLKGFKTLKEGDGDFKAITDAVVNVPTTILVDNAGNLIGDPVIGIQENYEKTYVSLLNQAMKQIGKKKITLVDDAEEDRTEEAAMEQTTEEITITDDAEESDEDNNENNYDNEN